MKKRPLWPLLLPIAVLLSSFILFAVIRILSPPGTECGIKKLTGLDCPGCGGTRCANDLLHGDLTGALSHNAMLFCGLAIFLCVSIYLIVRITILGKQAPSIPEIKTRWLWYIAGIILMFTILRNIPTWPFTLLAP